MANGVSGESKHECKFYDSIDQWQHQTRTVIKHVTTSANKSSDQPTTLAIQQENTNFLDIEPTLEPTSQYALKNGKKSFYDEAICMFSKMIENNSNMVRNLEKSNVLLKRVDRQIDKLIDKL